MIGRTLAGIALILSTPATAHDFWISPDLIPAQGQGEVQIAIEVGHGDDRQRSLIRPSRIMRFDAIDRDGRATDQRAALRQSLSEGVATLPAIRPLMLILESDNAAQSHLDAARFQKHIETMGLTPAIEHRAREGLTGEPGSEAYSRHAKTILRTTRTDADTARSITKSYNLLLEIVPLADPASTAPGSPFAVRIESEGRPLPGALVRAIALDDPTAATQSAKSNSAGIAHFQHLAPGRILIATAWTKRRNPDASTQYDTAFSSLTFGVPN